MCTVFIPTHQTFEITPPENSHFVVSTRVEELIERFDVWK